MIEVGEVGRLLLQVGDRELTSKTGRVAADRLAAAQTYAAAMCLPDASPHLAGVPYTLPGSFGATCLSTRALIAHLSTSSPLRLLTCFSKLDSTPYNWRR